MTNRELEILNIIKKNPLVSQNEIAEMLNITRSSVAVHIANLTKKGIIKGRGYLIEESRYVSVIGGANVDIVGFPNELLRRNDSNPGLVKLSVGGVARNIAENISRLGINTKLFTVVGDDMYGEKIVDECKLANIDTSYIKTISNESSGTYLAILDEKMDMDVAISSMDIFKYLNENYLYENAITLQGSEIIVLDTNLEKETLEYAVENYKDKKLFLDTVSFSKALRAKDVLGYFHTIKPNKLEVEAITGIKIEDKEDLIKASNIIHNLGVKNIVISLGEKGAFYSTEGCHGRLKAKKANIKNATGAGDAFQAGLVFGEYNTLPFKESVKYAMAASLVAMESEDTINKNISVEKLEEYINKLEEY
ncbi:winged helix-turn-helix transcriptional regulator [Soehngenia saccharolytica]|nr:winged helix-turn-helix transcriptional regulator [Soehngenia saccharolytica]